MPTLDKTPPILISFSSFPCYFRAMDIVLVTTIIASLFLVIGVAEPLAARLRLPYSVILAILGILIFSAMLSLALLRAPLEKLS